MKRVRYIGPYLILKGATALMAEAVDRVKPLDDTTLCEVQFDKVPLDFDGVRLDCGWHKFPIHDFEELP